MGKFTLRESARKTKPRVMGEGDTKDLGRILENASKSKDSSDFELLNGEDHVTSLVRLGKDGEVYWQVG